ncbi:MAG: copper-binding protein [Burkholderiales bacterium]
MKKITALLLATILSAAALAHAAETLTDGEIRKIDKDTAKVTIKHGPLRNLDMPAMTMVFRVKDPAMLEQLKAGDRIRFSADNVGGTLTVTHIETAK